LPARMTIFCIVSLRCFMRRDRPSDEPRKRPSGDACTDALASARPPRPGVVRAGALRQHGPAPRGVAGGNRTGLGDRSVGGICLLEEALWRPSAEYPFLLVVIGQNDPNPAYQRQANPQPWQQAPASVKQTSMRRTRVQVDGTPSPPRHRLTKASIALRRMKVVADVN
jgi:hypothetical protein